MASASSSVRGIYRQLDLHARQILAPLLLGPSITLALTTFVFILYSLHRRPDNAVEAELVYEASRVARGWPLYVDPRVGAWEGVGPPARFYVLYTPVWPWLLGHVAGPGLDAIRTFGRLIATASWLVIFAAPVLAAPEKRRRLAVFAACLGAATYFLARNAPSATPDTLAVALSCVGLVQIARTGKLTPMAAALIAIAPLVKPSCLGIALGVTLAFLTEPTLRTMRARACVVGALAFGTVALFCQIASSGAWLTHIVRSTGQPLTWARFVQEMGGRFVVLGLPHIVVAIVAVRRHAPRILTASLVMSIGWATFAMAKHGSGSQYWIEPTAAAVVVLSFLPASAHGGPRYAPLQRMVAVALLVVVGVIGFASYDREIGAWAERDAQIARLDEYCTRAPNEIVASSDIGVELALNGRITVPDWQTSFLARKGQFPSDAWARDLRDPHIRWIALPFDPSGPIGSSNDAQIEISAYRDLLRAAVNDAFVRDRWVDGFLVFRRRQSVDSISRVSAGG